MRHLVAAVLAGSSACSIFAGLGDFEDQVAGGATGGAAQGGSGGVAASGGSGGDVGGQPSTGGSGGAGGGACLPVPDWTSAFEVVWTFDTTETASLGNDATGNGNDLTVGTDVSPEATEVVQGSGSLAVAGPSALSSMSNLFQASEPFTFGAWLRLQNDTASVIPMGRFAVGKDLGFRMNRGGAGRVNCHIGVESSLFEAKSAVGSVLDAGAWHHVVCRSAGSGSDFNVAVAFDGVVESTTPYTTTVIHDTDATFDLPISFEGHIDEAFFTTSALSAGAIARIHACGIDGSACCCDAAIPTQFATCGHASDCAELGSAVACDASAPP